MGTFQKKLTRSNVKLARLRWGRDLSSAAVDALRDYSSLGLSIRSGDLVLLDGKWYVTHAGLMHTAKNHRCAGIHVEPAPEFSNPLGSHWAFKATVFKSHTCRGFVGYGDADPSNTSDLVRGAEMRVAETRAVNRALRKAYGISICSVEEIGAFSGSPASDDNHHRRPPQRVDGNSSNGQHRLRNRLCQLIRQHQLDPVLVKSYAVDFCGVKTLKEARREQVENFVDHIADWATKDKNALVCQLNSYLGRKEGAA